MFLSSWWRSSKSGLRAQEAHAYQQTQPPATPANPNHETQREWAQAKSVAAIGRGIVTPGNTPPGLMLISTCAGTDRDHEVLAETRAGQDQGAATDVQIEAGRDREGGQDRETAIDANGAGPGRKIASETDGGNR